MRRRAIVWFRQDLRLHDNEALTMALKMAEEVIPVYVLTSAVFRARRVLAFPKQENSAHSLLLKVYMICATTCVG
jgi:deoxyribodipyrimidine photo-lyase